MGTKNTRYQTYIMKFLEQTLSQTSSTDIKYKHTKLSNALNQNEENPELKQNLFNNYPELQSIYIQTLENDPFESSESELPDDLSEDDLMVHHAEKCKRYGRRRMAVDINQELKTQIVQLIEMNDKKKKMPCKTKNGKTSLLNLAEQNYRDRKRESVAQSFNQSLTPKQSYEMLMCRYLRLTPDNIKVLEQNCRENGYDVSLHPHLTEDEISLRLNEFIC